MYDEEGEEQMPNGRAYGKENKNKHKKEGEGRRLDEADQRKIAVELEKYSHPVNDQQSGPNNICNGQVASDTVNAQDALAIGVSKAGISQLS